MLARPELLHTRERSTAVIHLVVARSDSVRVMGPARSEPGAVLQAQGIAPAGPCYSWHPHRPTELFDFEVGFPVTMALTPTGRVDMSRLPAQRVACTVHQCGYDRLAAAWGEFIAWAEGAGLQLQGGLRESYRTGPGSGMDSRYWQTALTLPLTDTAPSGNVS